MLQFSGFSFATSRLLGSKVWFSNKFQLFTKMADILKINKIDKMVNLTIS